ncbi:hypothetical protein CEUSTIGMA_g4420.t1 [Chlamydomonas eustigma]|uniref:O-methyltransferase C-terminal domain-containing protein n=1 Tax=Chlamydomonas eustigma TaxID=1157962 RepID=A0A250X1K8_9CHLO|nr:hypothetical protein CEUSTIGMA_g4420.t1 [Chlamydomonas eustigma]|eukprot:GAX76973.1 hypothetical protein CEUSTIGMA_g4420.t1 [Chlamydomonas eustigma]
MRCCSLVHETAATHIATMNSLLEGRVTVCDIDFFSELPLPKGHDVITMGMMLHDWGLPRKHSLHLLMKKAFDALPDTAGGVFIAIEQTTLIDDERRVGTLQLGISLDMLLEFGEPYF